MKKTWKSLPSAPKTKLSVSELSNILEYISISSRSGRGSWDTFKNVNYKYKIKRKSLKLVEVFREIKNLFGCNFGRTKAGRPT